MAQITGRTRGEVDMPAVPNEAASTPAELSPTNTAEPARPSDPVSGPAHPNHPQHSGGGHGPSGGQGVGNG
jgi:hypothetical protein